MPAASSLSVLAQLQATIGSANWNSWTLNRWDFYDYVRYPAAGTTKLSFFNIAQGGVDPNSSLPKTLEQTNVPKARSFGQVYFIVEQIRFHYSILPKTRQPSGISSDANLVSQTVSKAMPKMSELIRCGWLQSRIGTKDWWQINRPGEMCPPGFGVRILQHGSKYQSAATAFTQASSWVQQNSDPDDVYSVSVSQLIEPEQTFEASLNWASTSPAFTGLVDSADLAIDIGMYLSGYIARPGQ